MHGALEQEELVRAAVRDGRGQLGRLVHEEHVGRVQQRRHARKALPRAYEHGHIRQPLAHCLDGLLVAKA